MADHGFLSPGFARAGGLDDDHLAKAMVDVELAWATATGADSARLDRLRDAAAKIDPSEVAGGLETGGNALIPLLAQWRRSLDDADARALHTGLTSQDVIDTALVLLTRDAFAAAQEGLNDAAAALDGLAAELVDAPAAAHTLGQAAEATTLGLRFAQWAAGLRRADEALGRTELPLAFGGAAGTGRTQSAEVVARWGADLGLSVPELPWHTSRWPVLRIGAAAGEAIAALGKIGGDVVTASRTEIAELAEPTGGTSSAMPHKQNPVRSILLRRSAIAVPGLTSTLAVAAGLAEDERPAGAWHAEWEAWRTLLRHLRTAASIGAELCGGLVVDADRAAAHSAGLTPPDQARIAGLIDGEDDTRR